MSLVTECVGKDEWYCNWYYCPECRGVSKFGHSARLYRGFKFCPDCGITLEWPEGAINGED